MAGLMGFPARGFRPTHSHDDSYSSDSDSFGQDTRDQRRMFAEFQRQPYMHRLHNQQSFPEGVGGFQSPFSNRGRPSPMMGGPPQHGLPFPLGMNMGGGSFGGVGLGMGMRPAIGMGIGVGMGSGMRMGRGGGIGYPSQFPFLGSSRTGYRQSSPFSSGHSHRSHPMFTNGHRQYGQRSWPQANRCSLGTNPFDDDEDDESDYDTSTIYNDPRQRRGGFRQLGRLPYGARHRPSWMHHHNNRYEEYDDEDEEDDESDYEEYYPVRRRRPRY